jgi:flagellin
MVSSVTNLGANAAKRYIEINSQGAQKATEELASGSIVSNPSYNPSASSVGYSLSATVVSLQQASRNVSQATSLLQMASGVMGATADVLTRMKELTVSANSDTVGSAQRQQMNVEFQNLLNQINLNASGARWGGASLFTGGAGAATANGAVTQAANGLNAVANAFAGTLNATDSQGMITGVASAATVTANGNLYKVNITVGNQTFSGNVVAPAAAGVLTLVSTSNPANVIALDYDASAVTAITNAATFQTSLQSLLGIGSAAATTANFASVSATAAGVTFSAGAATDSGKWALTYTGAAAGGTGTFTITNGASTYTATATTAASMTQTVTFGNGVSLALSAFNGTSNLAQATYDVAAGTGVSLSFQYGEKSTDVLAVSFGGANASALGLTNTNILTRTDATNASALIDTAQQLIGTQIANLGGNRSQLNFMANTLGISIQNQQAARSSFIDANIADSMSNLQQFRGLGQVSGTVFTQALNDAANLTSMVQSLR